MDRIKQISLACGGITIIDEHLFHEPLDYYMPSGKLLRIAVADKRWRGNKERSAVYVHSNAAVRSGIYRVVRLHRLIVSARQGEIVDHINGDTLDNRRANLRICTSEENTRNRKSRGGSSKYKGVTKRKDGVWYSYIKCLGQMTYLGTFYDEIEAAMAYDKAALEMFGSFARTNFGPVSAIAD